jgi:hypothetical protein
MAWWAADLRSARLSETDFDERRGSLLIRHRKGDKAPRSGEDQFGFTQLAAWLSPHVSLPGGPGPCIRPWTVFAWTDSVQAEPRAFGIANRQSRTGRRRHGCSSIEAAAAQA